MNILITSDNFLPGVGGTENAVLGLATSLTEQNHNVLLIVPHYGGGEQENDNNFPFKIFRQRSIKIDKNNYYASPFYSKKLDKIVQDFKPDIIHCHSQASMLSIALKIKNKYKIPCVCTIHTKFSYCYKNTIKSDLIVKILCKNIGKKLKKVDRVIAVSKDMGAEFKKYGYNGDFDIVKNGANLKQVDNYEQIKDIAIKEINMDQNANNLLFVGHISKVKNIDFIIDSLETLNKSFENFKMYLVGSGDNEKYFKQRVNNSTIKDKTIFTGKITDKQLLSSIYYNSKLFIFPSTFDNDSLAIIESATFETPSITLENTGSSERITNDVNGFVVKNDPNAMAQKIEYLLTHQDILSNVGYKAKMELPKTWLSASQEYLAIYQKAIDSYSNKN